VPLEPLNPCRFPGMNIDLNQDTGIQGSTGRGVFVERLEAESWGLEILFASIDMTNYT